MKQIYTIGYSCFDINGFISALEKYHITCLVDVRSNPHSKFYTDYNKENLSAVLKKHHILYRNYTNEFGARQTESKYYTDGILDFEKFAKSSNFITGIKKIESGINMKYNFALMCAEKDPSTCHRNIMVAKEFYNRGYAINNILSDATIETQDNVEKRLLNHYFPNRAQLSLFGDELTENEMVEECYKKRNQEIGFKLENLYKDGEYYG